MNQPLEFVGTVIHPEVVATEKGEPYESELSQRHIQLRDAIETRFGASAKRHAVLFTHDSQGVEKPARNVTLTEILCWKPNIRFTIDLYRDAN